jgi:hypothetical protein
MILDRIGRTLVLAAAAALSLAPLALTAPASASASKTAPVLDLFSGDATFTAGGHDWVLKIDGFARTASIELTTAGEDDLWKFLSVPASDLKANAKTGHATFKTGNSLKPIASVTLSFSPTKARKQACKSGSETVFSGHISGSVTLVASSTVTFKSAHVNFSSPFLDVNNNCVAKTSGAPGECFGGFWSAGPAAEAIGDTPGLAPDALTVSVIKKVVLKSPADATLRSTVTGSESKPSFNRKRLALTVKATVGPVSGSALLTSTGKPVVHTSTCTFKGKHFKSSDSEYFAKYASPTGHQLTGQSIILGKAAVARTGLSIFDIFSFKKASG